MIRFRFTLPAWLIVPVLLASSVLQSVADAAPSKLWVFVGTYTSGKSEGLYVLQMDLATGKLERKSVAKGVVNPSFVAIHPTGKFVYSVGEISDFGGAGKKVGAINAFAFDGSTGTLKLLNQQSSGGAGPCHVVVDRTGQVALAANYGGGSVCALPIKADGSLSEATGFVQHTGSSVNPGRQKEPHAHSINVDPANRFAVAADLGIDQVLVYALDPTRGTLKSHSATKVAPGAGPRHFAFHPSGKFAYVINELALTVTAFRFDAEKGTLTEIQMLSTLPDGASHQGSTAEVQVHPSGKFLYGSNRGHDSIVVYAIDQSTGRLTYVENESTQGSTPRNFGLDPTGSYLLAANQASDSIVVFRIDPQTGALTATGEKIEIPIPVCVKFLPVTE